ncbi:hypothetical protein QUF90_24530 [Desulfococcaceae bacterium HSG9]|nr:hypothetical protein [Desulfococcaceae bacterium HSG9]
MEKIFEIAGAVSTPLALSGFVASIFFFLFKQIIAKNIFPILTKQLSSDIIKLIIHSVFILSLVAMMLGFFGYILSITADSSIPAHSSNDSLGNTKTINNNGNNNPSKLIVLVSYQGSNSKIEVNIDKTNQLDFNLNVGVNGTDKAVINYSYKYLLKPSNIEIQPKVKNDDRCSQNESDFDITRCYLQYKFDMNKEDAEALMLVISYFIEGIQDKISYLASSNDNIEIKSEQINNIIKKYFLSEYSLVHIPLIQNQQRETITIKEYLSSLAKLNIHKYKKIQFSFDPQYLGFNAIDKIGETNYEISISVWRILQMYSNGTSIDYQDATKMKFRIVISVNKNKVVMKTRELIASETIDIDKYLNKRIEKK